MPDFIPATLEDCLKEFVSTLATDGRHPQILPVATAGAVKSKGVLKTGLRGVRPFAVTDVFYPVHVRFATVCACTINWTVKNQRLS